MNVYQYFEAIATAHISIAHTPLRPKFCVLENFEEQTATRADIDTDTPCLFMAINSGQLLDRDADNVQCIVNVSFFVVQRCDTNDYKTIYETYERMNSIALQIIGRLRRDSAAGTLQSFRVASSTFNPIAAYPSPNDIGYQYNVQVQYHTFEQVQNSENVWI
jgi:hypothetical protein